MSHWVKVGTKMSDIKHLTSALDRIKQSYEHKEGEKLTISAAGTTSECDIKLHDQLGLAQQKDGTFAFVGDFYYTDINQQKLTKDLQGQYCVSEATDRLEAQGFFLDNEEDALKLNDDGHIELTYMGTAFS